MNFLRIASIHRDDLAPLIARALGASDEDEIRVVTAGMGAFGSSPRDAIMAHAATIAARERVEQWDGIEIAAPLAVIASMGDLGIAHYRAVTARDEHGQAVVARDDAGAPIRRDGRDVLVLARYEIVAPPALVAAAETASEEGSEDGPLGELPSPPARLRRRPEAGALHYEGGRWYVAVAGYSREGTKGYYGGIYSRWVDATSLVA